MYILSIGCVIHCFFLPYLILIAPFFDNILIELALIIISVIAGTFIIYGGYNKHHQARPFFYYIVGVLLWLLHFISEVFISFDAELYLYLGIGFILISYYSNHRLLKLYTEDTDHGS